MATTNTYLAVFLGSKTSSRMMAWMALPEAERKAKEKEGIAAWKAWVQKHQSALVEMGGPLGKTKKVSARGTEDISNEMGAFTWCARSLTRPRPRCTRTIRTSRSSRASASKSCPSCRSRRAERRV